MFQVNDAIINDFIETNVKTLYNKFTQFYSIIDGLAFDHFRHLMVSNDAVPLYQITLREIS